MDRARGVEQPRITIVGPAFPWRGGLPLLVTELAHRLTVAGHSVRVQTWSRQGPARLLPAQRYPLSTPETAAYPTVPAPLSWRNPLHWWSVGRQAGGSSDLVVVVHYTTVQVPALATVARAAGRATRVVAICANAVPHEARPGDRLLTALLARAVDAVVVHTDAERAALAGLTGRPVVVAALPPHLPDARPGPRPVAPRRRVLFFGKVRRYKGVDVLLRALARVDGIDLTIAGEPYPDAPDIASLVRDLRLGDRVSVLPYYVPAAQLPALFAAADALVLPYRTATASQHVALANRYGLPTVVTRVGNFPDVVDDGVDGLVCAPGDVDDLARALRALYEPGRLEALRAAVRDTDPEAVWKGYLETLLLPVEPRA